MTSEKILSMIDDYFELEFRQLERIIKNPPHWLDVRRAKAQAIDRCLGVAFFVQGFDVPYEEIEVRYNMIKDRIERIKNDR